MKFPNELFFLNILLTVNDYLEVGSTNYYIGFSWKTTIVMNAIFNHITSILLVDHNYYGSDCTSYLSRDLSSTGARSYSAYLQWNWFLGVVEDPTEFSPYMTWSWIEILYLAKAIYNESTRLHYRKLLSNRGSSYFIRFVPT